MSRKNIPKYITKAVIAYLIENKNSELVQSICQKYSINTSEYIKKLAFLKETSNAKNFLED